MEHTTITTEIGTRVSVDAYENWETQGAPDNIWLNISVPMASASVVLNPSQARELQSMLQKIMEESESASNSIKHIMTWQ